MSNIEGTVLLITAHPDDECMFFTPTIARLQALSLKIHLLCLSNGNANGLGKVRERELIHACSLLGIPEADVTLKDDPRLPDGMETQWDQEVVAEHVDATARAVEPKMMVTFDGHGVSGHANHRATHLGVLHYYIKAPDPRPMLYLLESTSMFRKYLGPLDLPLSAPLFPPSKNEGMLCLWGGGAILAWRALKAHWSQCVWYRQLFVFLSRYTYVNTLRRVSNA